MIIHIYVADHVIIHYVADDVIIDIYVADHVILHYVADHVITHIWVILLKTGQNYDTESKNSKCEFFNAII